MDKKKNTEFVLNELNNAHSISKGLKTIENNQELFHDKSFSSYFNDYLANHQELKTAQIIKDSCLSRKYAYEIINGTKKASRDRIIALCFAAHMNLDEVNHALIYAGHNQLYAKNMRDAVIILVINQSYRGNSEYKTITELNILLDEQNQIPLDI